MVWRFILQKASRDGNKAQKGALIWAGYIGASFFLANVIEELS